jgi:transcriptional regulator with XRE-family HTH domain
MDGRQRAARAVAARRGELRMTQLELGAAAGVDVKTIGNLESRGVWPIARTRAQIEEALGWPAGEMERIAARDGEPELIIPPGLLARAPACS